VDQGLQDGLEAAESIVFDRAISHLLARKLAATTRPSNILHEGALTIEDVEPRRRFECGDSGRAPRSGHLPPGTASGPRAFAVSRPSYTPYNYEMGVDRADQALRGRHLTIPPTTKRVRSDLPGCAHVFQQWRLSDQSSAAIHSNGFPTVRASAAIWATKKVGIIHFDRQSTPREDRPSTRACTLPLVPNATNSPTRRPRTWCNWHRRWQVPREG